MFLNAAMAPAKLRPSRCHFLGGAGADVGSAVKAESAQVGRESSERPWGFMRTCSTISSSVLGRPDQHSSAAAIAGDWAFSSAAELLLPEGSSRARKHGNLAAAQVGMDSTRLN